MSEDSDNDQINEDLTIDFTPVCWYGIACYRKNAEHFRNFRHPHLQNDSRNETEVRERVEINIEIGHTAKLRTPKVAKGETHNWTAFVQCANQSATGFILEKVEFSFPLTMLRTPNVLNQPPFQVSGYGSRSFVMYIDISFKNAPNPKKTRIRYDLYLKDGATFSNMQLVKFTVINPPSDFRHRLLLAGGAIVQVPNNNACDNVRELLPPTNSISNKRKITDPTTSQSTDDDCYAFGQLCSSKLRKLETFSPPQKTLAEKLISEVLFHAERKSLTNNSCIQFTNQSSVDSPTIKTEPTEAATLTSLSTSIPPIKLEEEPSTELQQVNKTEVNTPSSSNQNCVLIESDEELSSSTVLHQVIKTEVNTPSSNNQNCVSRESDEEPSSSTELHQAIKTEVDLSSSDSDLEDCVIVAVTKPEVIKLVIIDIEEKFD